VGPAPVSHEPVDCGQLQLGLPGLATVCEYRTVTTAATSWIDVGDRVRTSRGAAGLTQTQLAERVGLQRSMVSKIEAGERGVDALELYRLADALGVPLTHLVSRPAQAVVSRRAQASDDVDEAGRLRYRLDIALEEHARRVGWLIDGGWLTPPDHPYRHSAETPDEARRAAQECRRLLGLDDEPLPPLTGVAESLGLYLTVVAELADGASLSGGDGWGAAVIGAVAEPGRRRMTAAHELGHHVLGDEYSSDVGVAASRDEREAVVQAFATEFLVPQDAITARLAAVDEGDQYAALLQIAAHYRASWSMVVTTASKGTRLDLRGLRSRAPVDADFLRVVGLLPAADLPLKETGPAYRRAVLRALDAGHVTPARASELLYDVVSTIDLEA